MDKKALYKWKQLALKVRTALATQECRMEKVCWAKDFNAPSSSISNGVILTEVLFIKDRFLFQ